MNDREFEEVFNELYPCILTYANGIVDNIGIAQEVCADSFIKLYNRSDDYDELINAKAYLFKITRNGCLDALRKIRHQTRSKKELQQVIESDDQGFFYRQQVKAELIELLNFAIEKLPTQCRRVFKMTIAGMSYEEIAKELKLSISTVRNQKARGIKLLRPHIINDI